MQFAANTKMDKTSHDFVLAAIISIYRYWKEKLMMIKEMCGSIYGVCVQVASRFFLKEPKEAISSFTTFTSFLYQTKVIDIIAAMWSLASFVMSI